MTLQRIVFGMLLLGLGMAQMAINPTASGAVIVIENSSAGFVPGEVLTSWRQGGSSGEITDSFDWLVLYREQLPAGPVNVIGLTDGQPFERRIMPWQPWPETEPDGYFVVRSELENLNFQALQARINDIEPASLAAWAAHQAASDLRHSGDWEQAATFRQMALQQLGRSTTAMFSVLLAASADHWNASRYDEGESLLRQALALPSEPTLYRAYGRNRLGVLLSERSRHAESRATFALAMEVVQALAGDSLAEADVLHGMANNEFWADQPDLAWDYFQRALAIRQDRDPSGLAVARTLGAMMNIPWRRGDLQQAQQLGEQALAGFRQAGQQFSVAQALHNLANIAHNLSRHERANTLRQESLNIALSVRPDSRLVADAYLGLGNTAKRLNDFRAARRYLEAAAEHYDTLNPLARERGFALSSLGEVYARAKLHDLARNAYQEALAIQLERAPDGLSEASARFNFAAYLIEQSDHLTAQPLLARSCEIIQLKAPGSWREAMCAAELGDLERVLGNYQQAEKQLKNALEIYRRRAPGTSYQSDALAKAARLAVEQRRPKLATQRFEAALAALDSQLFLSGGSHADKARTQADFEPLFKSYVGLLVDLQHTQAALQILQRYRQHGASARLQRNPAGTGGESAELDPAHALASQYTNQLDTLWNLPADELVPALAELERLRLLRSQAVNQASKRFTKQPRVQRLTEDPASSVAERHPHGAVVVTYSRQPDHWLVFRQQLYAPPTVRAIDADPVQLDGLVDQFRQAIQSRTAEADVRRLGAELHRLLLEPELLDAPGRLVIVPDGRLHLLPFAALVDSGGDPLIVKHPLVISTGGNPGNQWPLALPASTRLQAFAHTGSARAAEKSGLSRLTHAPREAARVGELFPNSTVRVNESASEAAARSSLKDAGILHFASHGVFDNADPMNSYLSLAGPAGGHDGTLYAWEVLEQTRLSASLVTLSACDSALGEYLPGAGLLGLTQAFQRAGADAVVAGLWRIADDTTYDLMDRFYRGLADGLDPPAALAQSQQGLASSRQHSHPFNWAAFHVYATSSAR